MSETWSETRDANTSCLVGSGLIRSVSVYREFEHKPADEGPHFGLGSNTKFGEDVSQRKAKLWRFRPYVFLTRRAAAMWDFGGSEI